MGWFKDTLPPRRRTASLMRLDGDMYESTMQAIEPSTRSSPRAASASSTTSAARVPAGKAIHDYRAAHGITDEIDQIDEFGAYWRKSS